MSDRCTGHCCKCFTISLSPEEVAEAYRFEQECKEKWKAGQDLPTIEACQDANGHSRIIDIEKLAPMLVLVAHTDKNPLTGAPTLSGEPAYFYTCRHLLPSGDCGAYDERPGMCKDYPYGRACAYDGCTWTNAAKMTRPQGLALLEDGMLAEHAAEEGT